MFHSFDPVTVRLSLDTTNVQHEKLLLELVKPYIEGFSVRSIKDEPMDVDDKVAVPATKRKNPSEVNAAAAAAETANDNVTVVKNKKKKNKK